MTLILIPTEFEADIVRPMLAARIASETFQLELCGFGPIAAAARTAQLIGQLQPSRVVLLGIAGSYEDRIPVGSAAGFRRVGCYGVGFGTGASFSSAAILGWSQLPNTVTHTSVGDSIELLNDSRISRHGTLLTCCSASSDSADAQRRLLHCEDASAEDMEGFSVALACQLTTTPFDIVRGISNIVGDRDKQNWRIEDALTSAADLAAELIDSYDR